MLKQREYAAKLQERFDEFGKSDEKISSVIHAIFGAAPHNMLIEEEILKDFFEGSPQSFKDEFSTFEKVDLIDYWEIVESDWNNKKR